MAVPPVPRRKVSAVVASGDHAAVFDAVCELAGRHPHDYVADVMREHLDRRGGDPDVRAAVRRRRRQSIGMRSVEDAAS